MITVSDINIDNEWCDTHLLLSSNTYWNLNDEWQKLIEDSATFTTMGWWIDKNSNLYKNLSSSVILNQITPTDIKKYTSYRFVKENKNG
jgi:hypothetical protein